MKIVILFSLLIYFPAEALATNFQALSKVTLAVVGEDNIPINDAKISISFETRDPSKLIQKTGFSGENGIFSASEQAFVGNIYYSVEKHGYYKSTGKYEFKHKSSGRWDPWNPELKVVLRPIINPVPMYARDSISSTGSRIEIPVLGEDVGFDLISYDWVTPYGSGIYADIFFKVEKRVVDRKDFESSFFIRFPDQFAGIQVYREETQTSYGSAYPLPRMAPLDGYESHLEFLEGRKPGERIVREPNFIEKNINYIFRTRTVIEDGKLVKAMYGKIHGPLTFDPIFSKTATIGIQYYLNPDYTRNLEFDPTRNLFGPLPPLEQVGIK